MRSGRFHIVCTLAALGLTVACASEPDLLRLQQTQDGPDEFAVVPNRPLEQPASYDALPPPTPGGRNRSDQTPLADAAAALGGQRNAGGGIQGPQLMQQVRRYGVDADIRATLAAEDLAFRRNNDARLLERVFGTNIYYRAYRSQSLDQYEELERLRRLGARTPAAPPQGRD